MHKRQRAQRSARAWAFGAAVLMAGGALAACGSDDGGTETTAPGETTAPAASTTVTDTATDDTAAGDTTVSGSDTTAPPDTAGDGEAPIAGGSLTYLNLVDTKGFDPALSNSPGAQNGMMNYALFDVLAHESSTGEMVLGLLESAESADAVTWTLRLKGGVQFTDGTPLDAAAVKFNWERLADPATGALSMLAAQTIASINVVDDTTLDVVLAEPNGQFLRTIGTTALTWIGSPTALQADPEGFNMHPVGAGAYMLKEATPGSEYVFERNPGYSGTTYVDEFRVKIITDEAQRLATLQAGDGDVANGITQANDAGFDSLTSTTNGGYVLFFNTQRAPFDDVRVRQAFALAMDGQELSDTVYAGNRSVANNVFQETSPFHDARFDQPTPDAVAAQQLFDEIAAERGGPLEVTLSYIVVLSAEAEWFQTKLAGFDNVKVNLEMVSPAEYQAKWSTGEVQFGMHAYWFVDPVDLVKFVGTGAPANFSQTADPEIDAALAVGAGSLDEQERIEAYATVQQKIVDDVPFVVFLRVQSTDLFDGDKVHGMDAESRVSPAGMLKITQVWVTP